MAVEKETQFEAWLEENMPEPGGGIITETFELNAAVGDDATDLKNFMDSAIKAAASVGFCAISVEEQSGNKTFFRYTTQTSSYMSYNFGPYNSAAGTMLSYYSNSITFRTVFSYPVILTWYHTPI